MGKRRRQGLVRVCIPRGRILQNIDIRLVVFWRAYYYDCEGVSREKVEISEVLIKVFREVNVVSKDHDVHIFEELPPHIQMRIIEDHEVVSTKDMYGMHEYFYNYRELWEDQKHDD